MSHTPFVGLQDPGHVIQLHQFCASVHRHVVGGGPLHLSGVFAHHASNPSDGECKAFLTAIPWRVAVALVVVVFCIRHICKGIRSMLCSANRFSMGYPSISANAPLQKCPAPKPPDARSPAPNADSSKSGSRSG